MTVNREGEMMWKAPRKYRCGCEHIEGRGYCPVHGEPLMEMIYGDKLDQDYLNEREKYKKQNLNE